MWDFPGGPVVKISPFSAGGVGSIAGRGTKIPHASRPKTQNTKQKQYYNKFNKDFKKWSTLGFPWWLSGEESACHRGHGFALWSGKIPHAAEQLSREPQLLNLCSRSLGAATSEALEPVFHNKRSHFNASARSPQLEKSQCSHEDPEQLYK